MHLIGWGCSVLDTACRHQQPKRGNPKRGQRDPGSLGAGFIFFTTYLAPLELKAGCLQRPNHRAYPESFASAPCRCTLRRHAANKCNSLIWGTQPYVNGGLGEFIPRAKPGYLDAQSFRVARNRLDSGLCRSQHLLPVPIAIISVQFHPQHRRRLLCSASQ